MQSGRHSGWWVALLVTACGAHRPAATTPARPADRHASSATWLTHLDRDHVLVDRIWDTGARSFVERARLAETLAKTDMLLLGEKHDNPDHHVLQAQLLEVFAGQHPGVAVAFEMLDAGQQPALDAYVHSERATPEGFGPALGWDKTGWPPWSQYAPIAEVALRRKMEVIAANLPTEQVRAVAHEGMQALGPATVARLRLDQPFPPALEGPLLAELQSSHCGHLPESALPRMAAAQHARDAQMAGVLTARARPVVLIAGAGHVRKDRAVPFFVRATRPEAVLTSVAFVEVESGLDAPASYADRFGAESLPFDFVWFTPRATNDDPCAAFRRK